MSKRPLEQIRQTLDSIVEDPGAREPAVDQKPAPLQDRLSQFDQRQARVESPEGLLGRHPMDEIDLASKLDRLIAALDEKHQPQTAGLVGLESTALGKLTERLSASLQTAMSVQLAPLSDDLPDRLAAVVASNVKSSAGGPDFTLPDLVRELEKFETRSMASLAARMTAGMQTAISAQLASITEELTQEIAAVVTTAVTTAVATAVPRGSVSPPKRSGSPFSDPDPDEQADAMSQELERVRSELAETQALLAEALEHETRSTAQAAASAEMAARLTAVEADRDRLQVALEENQTELSRARSEAETSSSDREQSGQLVEALRNEVMELRGLLAAKEYDAAQMEELRAEVARLRENAAMGFPLDQIASSAEEEELRDRLDRATCEIVDLRTQNEDLAEQVARLQVSTAPHGPMPHLGQEGMSWEERKRLLLQQLDAEQEDGSSHTQAKRVEINDILRTTEAELARRDREIAELRSLVQQQSDARQGMAVGAAAVAQLIESDELVQQEREKLRAIQKSWDEKLRQAEIDLSMERAKLARERLQLDEQKHKLEEALQSASAAAAAAAATEGDNGGKPADVKGRKWLSRLGLKEEN